MSRPGRDGARYTPEELDRALDLHHRQKLPWPVVAERMGRTMVALRSRACKYRKGQLKFVQLGHEREIHEIAEQVFSGLSMGEVARRRGCHTSTILQRLRHIGVDMEIIEQERAERRIAA